MIPVNPFPLDDPDRRGIWEMLILRDTLAFCASDWGRVASDFCDDSFIGIRGAAQPDGWRIAFSALSCYRDAWLDRAASYLADPLEGVALCDFLFAASWLSRIELDGHRGLALKRFDGEARTISGRAVVLHWQTVYLLRKESSAWRISGFIGYLPTLSEPPQ